MWPLFCAVWSVVSLANPQSDPLPAWNAGPAKATIIEFVAKVTKQGSPDFVPPAERIAVFDNDGTLWAEQPMYSQLLFALDRVKALASQHPEWKEKEPFASLLRGDVKGALAGGEHAILEILAATHVGMTTEEFTQIVKDWLATAKHPGPSGLMSRWCIGPCSNCSPTCRQRIQDLHRLRRRHRVYASWAEAVYGVPPEQVVGSSIKTKFELRNGKPVLVRLPEIDFIDDKAGKAVGINAHIGRARSPRSATPTATSRCWNGQPAGRSALGLIVHHDDPEREFAYDRTSPFGKLDLGLDEASRRGWTVVSMKHDWASIFPGRTHRPHERCSQFLGCRRQWPCPDPPTLGNRVRSLARCRLGSSQVTICQRLIPEQFGFVFAIS